ncbi:C-reactive protein-like [Misgurnus anguillicaudatus]|uniref:C-reactive protein-like n=1 Tax=Misgurnus anguillicaudatus TaxID=75329 RepID=UPI003CCF3DD0
MLELAVFLLCLLTSGAATGGLEDKVLLFPQKTNNSLVAITPQIPLNFTAFTLCMRVTTEQQEQKDVILFAYHTDAYEFYIWIDKDGGTGLYLSGNNDAVHFSLPPSLFTLRTHLCFTWSSSTGFTAAWMNGQRSVYQLYRKGQAIRPGGVVKLGQYPNMENFVGEITDMNLWDEVLTAKEIKGVYAHTTSVKVAKVIDWFTVEPEILPGINVEVINDDV